MTTFHCPKRFPGTDAEKCDNRLTHYFCGDPGDERCMDCDCRPGGIVAEWPCGQEPPRETLILSGGP